jgi:hypothetical protein
MCRHTIWVVSGGSCVFSSTQSQLDFIKKEILFLDPTLFIFTTWGRCRAFASPQIGGYSSSTQYILSFRINLKPLSSSDLLSQWSGTTIHPITVLGWHRSLRQQSSRPDTRPYLVQIAKRDAMKMQLQMQMQLRYVPDWLKCKCNTASRLIVQKSFNWVKCFELFKKLLLLSRGQIITERLFNLVWAV